MSLEIDETDWKQLRKFYEVAIERFCQRILDDLQVISTDTSKSAHQRYLEQYELIKDRHRDLGRTFDDLRHSNALIQLCTIQSLGLLTEQEFQLFTKETQDRVNSILSNRRA